MGGSPSAPPPRQLGPELGGIFNTFTNKEVPNFNNYFANQPLLQSSKNLALQGISSIGNTLPGIYTNQILPTLQSGGALTTQEKNAADQQAEAGFAQRGNLYGNQSVAGDLLNRDQYKQQKFLTALQAMQGVTSGVASAINPALATQNAAAGEYATFLNPLLNYGSDLYNTNYNAQAASNIAGANQSSGLAGGALSAVGSIAGAAAL